MSLLPTNKIEEKKTKTTHKSENSNDFYLKLPRLLPSTEIEETTEEYNKFQKIKFLLLIALFVSILIILQLNKQGI